MVPLNHSGLTRKKQGPQSNFETGGGGRASLVTQNWGGGHNTLLLTNSI